MPTCCLLETFHGPDLLKADRLKAGGLKPGTWALKPGGRAPASGQYERIGPRGGRTGHEVTVVRREPLPPTPNLDSTYRIVDRTRNDSGRGK